MVATKSEPVERMCHQLRSVESKAYGLVARIISFPVLGWFNHTNLVK